VGTYLAVQVVSATRSLADINATLDELSAAAEGTVHDVAALLD
jgi:hypothetical protein